MDHLSSFSCFLDDFLGISYKCVDVIFDPRLLDFFFILRWLYAVPVEFWSLNSMCKLAQLCTRQILENKEFNLDGILCPPKKKKTGVVWK